MTVLRHRAVNRRLVGHADRRQDRAVGRADAAASAVGRAVGETWARLWRELPGAADPWSAYHAALRVLRWLPGLLKGTLAGRLRSAATLTRREAVAGVAGALSTRYLAVAALDRLRRRPYRLTEAPGEPAPGAVELLVGALGLEGTDLAAALRGELPDAQARALFTELLWPPPPEARVVAWVDQLIAPLKMHGRKDLVPPERLAGAVSAGYAAGKTPREIARDLLPLVDDVRASAMRVARTWGMHVAHEVQQDCHDQLGDLVIGYQVRATLDKNTRPAHYRRHGTVYYREPGPGQLGYDQMPRPPREADGSIAWNCRCVLVPQLRPL